MDAVVLPCCPASISAMAHRTELNNDSTQGFERDPSGLGALHAKLESASKADLIALVKRLATDSDALAARIDYLTNPDTAANTLQHRIKSIRGGFTSVRRGAGSGGRDRRERGGYQNRCSSEESHARENAR